MILLDARILVIDVQRRGNVFRYDAGAEPSRCPAGDLTIEDQLHFLWPPEIKVFADDLLEEHTAVCRPIEHLRQ
jgi:hypothetical protein